MQSQFKLKVFFFFFKSENVSENLRSSSKTVVDLGVGMVVGRQNQYSLCSSSAVGVEGEPSASIFAFSHLGDCHLMLQLQRSRCKPVSFL